MVNNNNKKYKWEDQKLQRSQLKQVINKYNDEQLKKRLQKKVLVQDQQELFKQQLLKLKLLHNLVLVKENYQDKIEEINKQIESQIKKHKKNE